MNTTQTAPILVLPRGAKPVVEEPIKINSTFYELKDENFVTLEELEKEYLLKVLQHTEWNKEKAARILGVSVKTVYNKIEKYQIK